MGIDETVITSPAITVQHQERRIMQGVERFYQPQTIEEALDMLGRDKESVPVAGGTSWAKARRGPKALLDLGSLGLDYINNIGEEIAIGSMTTVHEIANNPILRDSNCCLTQAAEAISTRPLRNMITIGGNIISGFFWCELPVALLVLDAELVLEDGGSKMSMMELLSENPKHKIPPGKLLKEVRIPKAFLDKKSCFIKFARTQDEYALASVAISLKQEDGVCKDVRIAVGSLGPRPERLLESEIAVEGRNFEDALAIVAESVCNESTKNARKDIRFSIEYRCKLAGTLAKRVLENCGGGK